MSNTFVIWGDGVFGRLINRLPARPNDKLRMIEPMIVDLENATANWLNIDLNTEGVNEFGNPPGQFIRVENYPEDVLPSVPLLNGESLLFVVKGFNGTPSVITAWAGELKTENERLNMTVNTQKAAMKTILNETGHMAMDLQTFFKNHQNINAIINGVPEGSPMTKDEEDLEKGEQ